MPLNSKSRFFVTAALTVNLTGVTVSAISLYDTFPSILEPGQYQCSSTVWNPNAVSQVVLVQESQAAILE